MSEAPLTIGVHESGLARAQAEMLARALIERALPFSVHLEIVEEAPSRRKGLHEDHIAENRTRIAQLHTLLREGTIDVVIHRGFDLRGEIPDDFRVGAVLRRGNPYDVLVAPREVSLDEMEEGERVGVVQLRARTQLLGYRPDLEWELVEGDVGAWLTALIDGDVDALVAPGAAIENLALHDRVCEIFPPELLIPAPGSGVLLCLVRETDHRTVDRLRPLHHPATAAEYAAECAFMETLDGRWEHPIGALAQHLGEEIAMTAVVASADGAKLLRENHIASADDPCAVGHQLAGLLIEAGAERLLHPEESLDEAGLQALAGVLTAPPPDEALWDAEDTEPPAAPPSDRTEDDLLDGAVSLDEIEEDDEDQEEDDWI